MTPRPRRKTLLELTAYRKGDDAGCRWRICVLSEPDNVKRVTLKTLMGTVFDCFQMLGVPFVSVLGMNDLRSLKDEITLEIQSRETQATLPSKEATT